ncbi:heavy-metal-associated domain-containing protein [Streptomyces thermolilacinus]|uniref:heavy-metal-associated domain-containing protein n=1 Tax=Streptomyces thermolilacinus TaxID=285540 RepID=UPI0003C77044|nr:heavy-metal-associated domain-containing protein [Streptomyces thermolilacinus]
MSSSSSCCTPDGSCSTGAPTSTTAVTVADTTVIAFRVSGMTCGHCESAVTRSLGALEAVVSVSVDVANGLVTVTTIGEPDEAAIASAVDDAGYELTGRA